MIILQEREEKYIIQLLKVEISWIEITSAVYMIRDICYMNINH